MTINPWINFNGNAEEAFVFYQSILGGEFVKITRFAEVATPEFPVADADANKIMQIVLAIDDFGMLIGNDVPEFMGKVAENENRSKIHIGTDSREEALQLFSGLSEGGEVELAIEEGADDEAAFSMFRDVYGIEWIVEFDPNV